jgi:hypothetical protein
MGRFDTLTDEELQRAWQDCKRPHWPPTLEACRQDEVLDRIIKMHAAYGLPARARLAKQSTQARQQRRAQQFLQALDYKSLAAGEGLDKDKEPDL